LKTDLIVDDSLDVPINLIITIEFGSLLLTCFHKKSNKLLFENNKCIKILITFFAIFAIEVDFPAPEGPYNKNGFVFSISSRYA
jgi:hypothetical protein